MNLESAIEVCHWTSCSWNFFQSSSKIVCHLTGQLTISRVSEETLSLEEVTTSLKERSNSSKIKGKARHIRSKKNHQISFEWKLWHDRTWERCLTSHHVIADHANLVKSLVRKIDNLRSLWRLLLWLSWSCLLMNVSLRLWRRNASNWRTSHHAEKVLQLRRKSGHRRWCHKSYCCLARSRLLLWLLRWLVIMSLDSYSNLSRRVLLLLPRRVWRLKLHV